MTELIPECQASVTRMLAECDAATHGPFNWDHNANGDYSWLRGEGSRAIICNDDRMLALSGPNAQFIAAAVNMHRAALELLQNDLRLIQGATEWRDPSKAYRVTVIARVLACADPAVADALKAYEEGR